MDGRPICPCHGEPMLKNGLKTWTKVPTQDWRCGVNRREKSRRYFEGLEHIAWSKRLLQMRRAHAMWRRRKAVS